MEAFVAVLVFAAVMFALMRAARVEYNVFGE
jgi:hypothetical protein